MQKRLKSPAKRGARKKLQKFLFLKGMPDSGYINPYFLSGF